MADYKKERIHGYEEYQVDTNGIVYGKNGKPLKHSINPSGYCIVNLCTNGMPKGFSVHVLVAKQFLQTDGTQNLQVNHIDGNKTNNNVENLEWVTRQENMNHAKYVINRIARGSNKTNARRIKAIAPGGNLFNEWGSIADAAISISGKEVGYEGIKTNIWRVLTGRRKTYKGFYWVYSD